MNDSKKNLWEALQELSDIQKEVEERYHDDAVAFWNNFTTDEKIKLFYYVVRNLADAELKDDFESYRHILYTRFGFPTESYMIGMMCRFMELHNSILRPSEQSAYREFYYERAKENAKKRDDN
jgi:hypothetical protein